jgi:transcriptional regulator with XRE-family HTH domain
MIRDYRDKLQDLLNDLHTKEGVTRYRISKRSGIREQTLSNVMHKRRNLSIEALERLLDSIGYEIQFAKSASNGAANGARVEHTSLEADTTALKSVA